VLSVLRSSTATSIASPGRSRADATTFSRTSNQKRFDRATIALSNEMPAIDARTA
jgi:hypothetical protein